jgi:hypothetical protein
MDGVIEQRNRRGPGMETVIHGWSGTVRLECAWMWSGVI